MVATNEPPRPRWLKAVKLIIPDEVPHIVLYAVDHGKEGCQLGVASTMELQDMERWLDLALRDVREKLNAMKRG